MDLRKIVKKEKNGELKEILVDWEKMPCAKCEWRYTLDCPQCEWNRNGDYYVY